MKTPGYLQVYTGNGKGKTTAALGLAIRAAGRGLTVYFGQFMKGSFYGEQKILGDIPEITLVQFGSETCIRREDVTDTHIEQARTGLEQIRKILQSREHDLVILDEVNVAVWFGLLTVEEVLTTLDHRPENVELVLTGRYAPDAFIDRADLVTEMREIKHYYSRGIPARDGIER